MANLSRRNMLVSVAAVADLLARHVHGERRQH